MVKRKAERATLADVAARAGVSLSTASKVLNSRADVAATTRANVEAAMADLGYVSRSDLRGPSQRRSVLVVLGDGVNPYAAEIIEGILVEAAELAVSVALSWSPTRDRIDPAELVAELSRDGHCGVVIITPSFSPADLAYLVRRRIAMAMIDPFDPTHDQGVSVGTSNWSGGLTATQYLLDQGHRRVGLVGGLPRSLVGQARLHGYRAALERSGIEVDPDLIGHGNFRYESGLDQGRRLLALARPPTAVFATSDPAALGVMAAAREHGLVIPQDLSVVGFDDTWAAQWAVPPLTTIRQPMPQMGRVALRAVIDQADGEVPTARRVELNTELVIRNSVAPPPD